MGATTTAATFTPTPSTPWWSASGMGEDDGPRGKTVFLTNAPVDQPLQPFDDDDDRSLIGNCYLE